MQLKSYLEILILLIVAGVSNAQVCTTLGQNPTTAFPVCGVDTFSQSTVPLCGGTPVPGPCTDALSDVNPFWYKFTCFTGGTLGFTVTPIDLNDDYDWQIFDITNRNPMDVFTNATLFVACNWSGRTGITGASNVGTTLINCAGTTYPTFSSMPTLIQGHEYLLLLSNFSASQKGYKLAFGGGTASITDPLAPHLSRAVTSCGGLKIGVKLNKKMRCNSLAANGSDFSISPAVGTVIGASATSCSTGFDMDSVVLTVSNTLPPGNYTLLVKNGSDGNTLLDVCKNGIPDTETIPFTVFPVQPTPMDSIKPVGCAPTQLQLVFRQPILCSTVAANGSDFTVTGPTPVTVASATGNCSGSTLTTGIQVTLGAPLQVGGIYRITLKTGTDGNTIQNDCNLPTPVGSFIDFVVKDTVSAAFTYSLQLGCTRDTINLLHDGRNGVNSWRWSSNGIAAGTQQGSTIIYPDYGNKTISLIVSNGVCSDTASETIVLDNELTAAFSFPDVVCPEDRAVFVDKSVGKIQSWAWNFGTGFTSTLQNPGPQQLPAPTTTREAFYTVRLIVQDAQCSDTVEHRIKAVNTCRIAVPNAFTPNSDGRNDFLYPLNAYKADQLTFKVYNRFGQVVFETRDWTKKWDGTINGRQQPTGTYVWLLQYIDHDTGAAVVKKGTTVLIR